MAILTELPALQRAYQPILDWMASHHATRVFSVAGSQKLHLAISSGYPLLYVVEEERVEEVQSLLRQMGRDALILPPAFDPLLVQHQANLSNVSMRLDTLLAMAKMEAKAVVVSPQALMQYLPKPQRLLSASVTIAVGESIDPLRLADTLTAMGYTRAEHADTKGTFATLGESVEIFPLSAELPARILLEYDTIESIKYYRPETMQGVQRISVLQVPPATDMLYELSVNDLQKRVEKCRVLQAPKARLRTDELLGEIGVQLQSNPKTPAGRWLLPFMTEEFATLFDYLLPHTLVVMDEPSLLWDALNACEKKHIARVEKLTATGDVLREHTRAIPELSTISKRLSACKVLGYSSLMAGEIHAEDGSFVLGSTNLPAYTKDINLLAKDLAEYAKRGYSVSLYCGTREWATSMGAMLQDYKVNLLPTRLDRGFVHSASKCVVVGTKDMSLSTVPQVSSLPAVRVQAPNIGDYVVHEEYGIGQCLGVQHIKSYVGEMDYVVLRYAGENKIYVPMHQLCMLKLYAGAESTPKLSNPNKDEFRQQKNKARASIRKLAFDLLELYAKREQSTGYRYPADTPFQREFEAAFEFDETPDQLEAISAIKKDMEEGRVMDRLLCGDVGFGKTEVALRAIFKTIMANKQAAFLAPTTILTEQHYMTVLQRLAPFGIKVACLSRFRTPAEVKSILKGIANGTISVVVGTHRLLSKDVEFYDLGLLVLDEEQRFGVEHKERIKTMRHNVNVLSMSATPIPRTLHMALSGIRDVSVLETPPKGRQSVETVVASYGDALMVDAIERELGRGGQVFVLYNSVERIYTLAHRIQELVPHASIVVGHGQMSPVELERSIYKFYCKEAQILVATTIIENGIDVPNANTLFVLDAHKLGLSQMYQLKGRVGRSTRRAVAYFTVPDGYVPTGDVEKRLTALTDNAGLGSGYRLALMDLEIRGAGDVLGREQHGHVEKIGYDMYCKLLRETIALLKGETLATETNTEVSINVDAYIPGTYVESERERMRLYQRIAAIKGTRDANTIRQDISELYGKAPKEVENLIAVSLLRVLGSRVGVSKIEIDNRFCRLRWENADYMRSVAVRAALRRIGDVTRLAELGTVVELMPIKNLISYKMTLATNLLQYASGEYSSEA